MRRNRPIILFILLAAAVALAACGESDSIEVPGTIEAAVNEAAAQTDSPSTTGATDTTSGAVAAEATDTTGPDGEEPGCDWDSARLSSDDTSEIPSAEGIELAQALLGSWQHTHTDTGAGFEAVGSTIDIRFVLSSDRFLYCQDVDGATDKSERSVPLVLEGTEIILPSPAYGYAVTAWSDTTMVWLNHFDDSLYLLQRR